MKRLFLAAAVLLCSIQMFAQSALTPIQFNDKLTGITEDLYARGQGWGKQFNQASESKNYSSLRPYRMSMITFIDEAVAKVKVMADVNNSKPLRMAMISFLQFEKKMAVQAFQPFERFNASTPSEQITKALDNLKEISKGEGAELAKVAEAQAQYGKENGFRIETAEEAALRSKQ
jgi:hypothetical protein